MTDPQQSQPGTDGTVEDPRDSVEHQPAEPDVTERRPGGSDDLGGPASTLGGGVENALTGEQATEDDQGSASTSPQPRG
jgi:hypothetical protein